MRQTSKCVALFLPFSCIAADRGTFAPTLLKPALQSRDGAHFSKPQKLGDGTWPLNACPIDGGGVVVSGERITTAWRRGDTVYLAEPGKPEVPLGVGKDVLWHDGKVEILAESGAFPSLVALPDGSLVAAWEHDGEIVTRRVQ